MRSNAYRMPSFLQLDGQRDCTHLQQNGRGSTIFEEIFAALQLHRVETLFIAKDQQIWGLFSKSSNVLEVHPTRRDDDENLLNLLAKYAISKKVYWAVLLREEIPNESSVAAIYDY